MKVPSSNKEGHIEAFRTPYNNSAPQSKNLLALRIKSTYKSEQMMAAINNNGRYASVST